MCKYVQGYAKICSKQGWKRVPFLLQSHSYSFRSLEIRILLWNHFPIPFSHKYLASAIPASSRCCKRQSVGMHFPAPIQTHQLNAGKLRWKSHYHAWPPSQWRRSSWKIPSTNQSLLFYWFFYFHLPHFPYFSLFVAPCLHSWIYFCRALFFIYL